MEPGQRVIHKNKPGQHVDLNQPPSSEESNQLQWFTVLEQVFPAMYRRLRNLLMEYGHDIHPDLDSAGYLLLIQIRHRGPIRAAQMAEQSNLDKSAISRQVRLLLNLKLIERLPDPNDSRAYLLVATEEGTRRIDQLQVSRLRRLQATFPHLTQLLEAVVDTLTEDGSVR